MVTELTAEQAYKVCDADNIGCDSSQELTTAGDDRRSGSRHSRHAVWTGYQGEGL